MLQNKTWLFAVNEHVQRRCFTDAGIAVKLL